MVSTAIDCGLEAEAEVRGLAWHPDGRRLFSSGGGENTVRELRFVDSRLAAVDSHVLARPSSGSFVAGLAVVDGGLAQV